MRAAYAFATLSVFLSLSAWAYAAKCNCQCPFNYDPVCAADSNGKEETYPNECSLECYKCTHNKNLVIRSRGECANKSPGRASDRSERQKTAPSNSNPRQPHRAATPRCNCNCPLNYDPVCAVDSKGNEETYPNECSFECYKCTHGKDGRVRSRGECSGTRRPPTPNSGSARRPDEKCKCVCTQQYTPVCSEDSKGVQETYPSRCAFECYKCTHGKDLRIIKEGECSGQGPNRPIQPTGRPTTGNQRDRTGRCNCRCSLNYVPVCAVDSKGTQETYPNSCSFECYKCTHGKDVQILKQGECSNKGTPRPSRPTNRPDNCDCYCSLGGKAVCIFGASGTQQMFPNQCALDCHVCRNALKDVKSGTCSESSTGQRNTPRPTINNKRCNCNCGQDYSPLCAVNSKGAEQTFPNRCTLDCFNCSFDEDYVLRRRGECQSRTPHPPRSKTRAA